MLYDLDLSANEKQLQFLPLRRSVGMDLLVENGRVSLYAAGFLRCEGELCRSGIAGIF